MITHKKRVGCLWLKDHEYSTRFSTSDSIRQSWAELHNEIINFNISRILSKARWIDNWHFSHLLHLYRARREVHRADTPRRREQQEKLLWILIIWESRWQQLTVLRRVRIVNSISICRAIASTHTIYAVECCRASGSRSPAICVTVGRRWLSAQCSIYTRRCWCSILHLLHIGVVGVCMKATSD